jgi:hypothetical protein
LLEMGSSAITEQRRNRSKQPALEVDISLVHSNWWADKDLPLQKELWPSAAKLNLQLSIIFRKRLSTSLWGIIVSK